MRGSGIGVSGAGASALHRYRALASAHRWERRTVRVVVACSTGVVTAGVSVWWAGLLAGALFFCGHAVYTRYRPGPVTGWRRGALAERRTGRRLARLDPAGYHVLHDRALPDDFRPVANLDHLVVGLSGVYAIASRRFRLGARLRADQRGLWVGPRSVPGVTRLAMNAADVVAEMLTEGSGQDVHVTPMVVVHGARVARDSVEHERVLFCAARTIPRAIAREPVVYTSAQVATIAAAAERLLPPMMEIVIPE